jgi:radical SAM superfamily enzyme YgiQ (UPF0313 family)
MRLLLLEPPFYRLMEGGYGLSRYPLGLGYLAAMAAQAPEWRVAVYDADFEPHAEPFRVTFLTGQGFLNYRRNLPDASFVAWRQARQVIERFRPRVVGISLRTPTLAAGLALARLVKAVDPGIVVVAGGPHATVMGPAVLDHPELDLAVLGEGEATLPELLRALGRGKDPAEVAGLAVRRNGRGRATAPRAPLAELDSLPFPHLAAGQTLMDFQRYPSSAFRGMMASRGCPRRCSYCGSGAVWDKVRRRTPENVASEARCLMGLGVGQVRFEDDTFGVNQGYLAQLCQTLGQQAPGLAFTCETHVGLISPASLAQLKQAGCQGVQLGIESGHDDILQAMGKGFSARRAWEACGMVRAAGLRLEVFFMVGHPRETEASLKATLRMIQDLPCDKIIYSIFTPYPGTADFGYCQRNGLIPPDFDPSLHNHQSPANHFCPEITAARFRELAGEVEQVVEARNLAAS